MPLACAHPAAMLAAARSAVSSRSARRNRRPNVFIIPHPTPEASPFADIPSTPCGGLDWFMGGLPDQRRTRKLAASVR